MAYVFNIPQSTDQLSVSQGQILGNFTALGAIAGNTNASSASLNSTSGFNWLYLPPQGSTPPAGSAFTSGNVGLYSATNSNSTFNELYISKTANPGGSGSTTVQIPMTAGAQTSPGWTYLPSGILLKWHANISLSGLNTKTINVNTDFSSPNFTNFINILISPGDTAATFNQVIGISSISFPNFTVYVGNSNVGSATTYFNYLVIGY